MRCEEEPVCGARTPFRFPFLLLLLLSFPFFPLLLISFSLPRRFHEIACGDSAPQSAPRTKSRPPKPRQRSTPRGNSPKRPATARARHPKRTPRHRPLASPNTAPAAPFPFPFHFPFSFLSLSLPYIYISLSYPWHYSSPVLSHDYLNFELLKILYRLSSLNSFTLLACQELLTQPTKRKDVS